jgi:polyribonucleotide nucleotidyltransferase
MDPAPAPTYDAPATRSNKRKESGHVDIEEPIPRKRGPGRPRTKAESKEDVSKGVNNELLQKTKRTAQQILDANTQLSSYAEEAFRVGRNVLAIYNMLADNMDDLIGAVEKEERGDDVKNIIRKVQKTRYDTVINNITPLFTKMEELPALREPLLVQLAIDKKTADEVRD